MRIESLEVRDLLAGITDAAADDTASVVRMGDSTGTPGVTDSGIAVFTAAAAASRLVLQLDADGDTVQIQQDGELVWEIASNALTELTIEGNRLDNTLVVDLTNGNPIPAAGLFYHGGEQVTELGDALHIVGASSFHTSYTPTVRNDGVITLISLGAVPAESRTIYFTGLEPVLDNMPGTDVMVGGTADGNAISYTNGPGGGVFASDTTGLVAVDNFETIEFSNKPNLNLNALEGDDVITLNADLPPTRLTSIQVSGGSDDDTVDLVAANVQNLSIDGNDGDNTTRVAGAAPGIFAANNIVFQNTALEFQLGGTAPGAGAGFHDQLNAFGVVALGNNVTLAIRPFADAAGVNFVPTVGDQFVIVTGRGSVGLQGTFAGLPEGAQFIAPDTNQVFSISYRGGGQANDVVLTYLGTIEVEIVATANLAEDGASHDLQLTLATPIALPAQVDIRVIAANVSSDDNDYDAAAFPKIVSFPAGSAGGVTATVAITPTADNIVEADETLRLDLVVDAGPAGVGANGSSTVTIVNDDLATLTIDDVTFAEGDGPGNTAFTFTVSSDRPAGRAMTTVVNTVGVTAGDLDFVPLVNQTVTIAAGSTTATVTVQVPGDLLVEATETFQVNLTDARFDGLMDTTRVLLGDAQGIGTITDNDRLVVEFSQSSGSDAELSGGNLPQLLISGTVQAAHSVTIDVAIVGGSATGGGVDYTNPTTVTIAAGTYNATAVAIGELAIIPDMIIEADETIQLGALTGSQIQVADADGDGATQSITQYTIQDIGTATANLSVTTQGAEAGPVDIVFTVTLDQPNATGAAITFDLADLATGTASSGDDYVALGAAAQISIAPGTSTGALSVQLIDDTVVETLETMVVQIANPSTSAVLIGMASATASITDNDMLAVEFSQATGQDVESSGGNLPQLLVTGIVQAGHQVTIDMAVLGSSTASGGGVDYNAPTAVTVGAGTYNAVTIPLPSLAIADDTLIESNETIELGMLSGNQIQVADADGDGMTQAATQYTIEDDEVPATAVRSDGASQVSIRDVAVGGKDDRLALTIMGGNLVITDLNNLVGDYTDNTTGSSVEVPLASIASIQIDLLEGDDRLSIDFAGLPTGLNLPVTIRGGGGHDTLTFSGTTQLDTGQLGTDDTVEDIFINAAITMRQGAIALHAVQSLEVNADIGLDTGALIMTAGRDVFGNCSQIDAGAADVQLVSGTGIAGLRVRTGGHASLNGGTGGIAGCGTPATTLAAAIEVDVEAEQLTLLADASVGSALLRNGIVSDVQPLRTRVPRFDGQVGGLGIFLANQGAFDASRLSASGSPGFRIITEIAGLSEGEGAPRHNFANRMDVNNDGAVSPGDVLAVVNHLNGAGAVPQSEGPATNRVTMYLDVNGDQTASPVDALLIINYLNARIATPAEGESYHSIGARTSSPPVQNAAETRLLPTNDVGATGAQVAGRELDDEAIMWPEAGAWGQAAATSSSTPLSSPLREASLAVETAAAEWESWVDEIATEATGLRFR